MALSLKRPNSKLPAEAYRVAALWGFACLIALCLTTFLTQAFDYKTSDPYHWVHAVVLFMGMVAAALVYRKRQQGILPMRQAYVFCVCIGVIASLGFAVFINYYGAYVNLDFVPNFVAHQSELIAKSELSAIQQQNELRIIQGVNASWLAGKCAMELVMLSVFVPLLLSLFVRREMPKALDEKQNVKKS